MSTPPPPPVAPAAWPSPPDPPELPAGVQVTSGRPPWPPVTAFLAIFAALLAAVGGTVVIAIIAAIFGADSGDPPPAVAIGGTVLQDLCFVGAVVFFAARSGPTAPWQLGLRGTHVWKAVGWMALAFLVLVIVSYGWTEALGVDQDESLPDELGVESGAAALAATAVLVTVLAPIAEELLFRAYVFPALRNWKGTWPAVVIAGLLFGALHLLGSPAYAILPLAVFGALLCLLYLKTRSLYPCIALHSLNNSIAFGGAPEVGWDWQIPVLAAGALASIAALAYLVRRIYGAPPPGLSPV